MKNGRVLGRIAGGWASGRQGAQRSAGVNIRLGPSVPAASRVVYICLFSVRSQELMLPHKFTKIKRPSPIQLTHSSCRRRVFVLICWISNYRRTADVVVEQALCFCRAGRRENFTPLLWEQLKSYCLASSYSSLVTTQISSMDGRLSGSGSSIRGMSSSRSRPAFRRESSRATFSFFPGGWPAVSR